MPEAKRPRFLGRRVPRSTRRTAGDALGDTKLAYAFNGLASGLLDMDGYSLREVTLVQELVPSVPLSDSSRLDGHGEFVRSLAELLRSNGTDLCEPPVPRGPIGRNLKVLSDLLGLSDPEQKVFVFALACGHQDMRDLCKAVPWRMAEDIAPVVAQMTALAEGEVRRALRPGGLLMGSGLLERQTYGEIGERLKCDARLADVLGFDKMTRDHLLETFVPAASAGSLGVEDFAHLEKEFERASALLRRAIAQGAAGVNILLHGPTGTGKSELARAIAAEVGVPLLLAGGSDEDGHSPNHRERLAALLVGNHVATDGRGVLLFEEIEDLFSSGASWRFLEGGMRDSPHMSKAWFNRLLETNAVPTIWIANEPERIDPAFLRRFSFVIELDDFTAGQRRRVWQRHLGNEVPPPTDLEALVQRYEVSPAHIGSAVRTARMMADGPPDRSTLDAILGAAMTLEKGSAPSGATFDPQRYLLDVVNASENLEELADRLASWTPGTRSGISLCLHGPSGTGKSEFARYLAHRMDRPLLVRRTSDVLSCWVGNTERNIRRAFSQAQRDGAVLVFDEVDSFLQDCRRAVRTWEMTEVNEFLQQLDAFDGVAVCTTNLVESLDPAALRRFLFKIRFDYLRPEQAERLLAETLVALGVEQTGKASVRQLPGSALLTPGDFAVAERRLRALDQVGISIERFLREAAERSWRRSCKPAEWGNPMGHGAPPGRQSRRAAFELLAYSRAVDKAKKRSCGRGGDRCHQVGVAAGVRERIGQEELLVGPGGAGSADVESDGGTVAKVDRSVSPGGALIIEASDGYSSEDTPTIGRCRGKSPEAGIAQELRVQRPEGPSPWLGGGHELVRDAASHI